MDKKLTFHYDAGHGWLEVDASELERMGIAGRISGYSYRRGGKAYLEEDVDAGVYIKAAGISPDWIAEIYDGDSSPVRTFAHYR